MRILPPLLSLSPLAPRVADVGGVVRTRAATAAVAGDVTVNDGRGLVGIEIDDASSEVDDVPSGSSRSFALSDG